MDPNWRRPRRWDANVLVGYDLFFCFEEFLRPYILMAHSKSVEIWHVSDDSQRLPQALHLLDVAWPKFVGFGLNRESVFVFATRSKNSKNLANSANSAEVIRFVVESG